MSATTGSGRDAVIQAMAEEMASEFRLPIIRIIEGSGGGGSVKTIETKGASNLPGGVGTTRGFHYMTANMAQVPVVGLGLGSVAGLGAAGLLFMHAGGFGLMAGDAGVIAQINRDTAQVGDDQCGEHRHGKQPCRPLDPRLVEHRFGQRDGKRQFERHRHCRQRLRRSAQPP